MSISQNFPEEGPTLNLNFAGSKTLDPRITFSRTTTGTYMDANGLIVTAPADAPRFDHRYVNGEIESLGLLVEESRSNLITYSEQFDNVAWTTTYYTVGIDSTTAPDGTTSAEKLIRNTTNTQAQINRNITGIGTNTTYTLSCFCKSAEWSKIGLREGVSTGNWATFDLSLGEEIDSDIDVTTTIDSYPDEWYRISMTMTTTGTQTSYGVRIIPLPDSYTSGTPYVNQSGNDVDGLYLWGAQLEEGAFPTSYMPRPDTSTATRNSDSVSMTGDNFSDWYNQSEGSIFMQSSLLDVGNTGGKVLWSINQVGGFGEGFYMVNENNQTSITINAFYGGSSQAQFGGPTGITTNQYHKTIFSYQENNVNACFDGTVGIADTSVGIATVGRLVIGNNAWGNILNPGDCHISQLTYYPTRLTNTQLQTLTK